MDKGEDEMSEKKYFPEIDVLKGFAIFLVVLGHSIIVYPVNLHENADCLWLFDFVSSVHMPLFFLISGFCFSMGGHQPYLWKKTKRILIPYVIFTLLDMVPRSLLGFLFNRPRDMSESLKQMVFYGGAKWFLYVLFIIFLIYPAIYAFHKKNRKKMMIVEAVLLVLALIGIPTDLFRFGSVVYYLFYFHSGLLIRSVYPVIKEWYDGMKNGTAILMSVISVYPIY